MQIVFTSSIANNYVPDTVNVAIFATYKTDDDAIEDVCHYIENNLSDIIQLPELFFVDDKMLSSVTEHRACFEQHNNHIIEQITAVLRPFQYVCTSLIMSGKHQAVLINNQGIFAHQSQLTSCHRYRWSPLGQALNIITLPLEHGAIELAMLTGDDFLAPKIVGHGAANNIQLLLVPFDIQEQSDASSVLKSLAQQFKLCIVASTRERSFLNQENNSNNAKLKRQKSTGLIIDIAPDYAVDKKQKITNDDTKRLIKFNLKIKPQQGKITKAIIHPNETNTCSR